ncbi:hypothetical protein IWX75_003087 [Arthrobacter sp. CAN_A6]
MTGAALLHGAILVAVNLVEAIAFRFCLARKPVRHRYTDSLPRAG